MFYQNKIIMKTIRVYLSILTFVFAFGATLASQLLVPGNKTGWEFIDMPGTEDDSCELHENACDEGGNVPCTISGGTILRSNNNVADTPSCGADLKKIGTP